MYSFDEITGCMVFSNDTAAYWWHLQTHTDHLHNQMEQMRFDAETFLDLAQDMSLATTITNNISSLPTNQVPSASSISNQSYDYHQQYLNYKQMYGPMLENWNCSRKQYEEWYQNASFSLGLVVIVIWSVLGIFGLLANGIVIYILLYFKNWKAKMSNVYLFYLSVADFTVLITMYFKLYEYRMKDYGLGSFICGLSFSIDLSSQLLSGWMLILISLDRLFIALGFTKFRTVKFANTSCLMALILCLPIFLLHNFNGCVCQDFKTFGVLLETCQKCVVTQSPNNVTENLNLIEKFNSFYDSYFLPIISFIHFGLTFIGMIICYGIVLHQIKKIRKISNSYQTQKYEIMVTTRTVILVSVFVYCWIPYYIFSYAVKDKSCVIFTSWYQPTHILLMVLSYTPAILNPFLYAGMSDEFKTQLIKRFVTNVYEMTEDQPGPDTRETNLPLTKSNKNNNTGYFW